MPLANHRRRKAGRARTLRIGSGLGVFMFAVAIVVFLATQFGQSFLLKTFKEAAVAFAALIVVTAIALGAALLFGPPLFRLWYGRELRSVESAGRASVGFYRALAERNVTKSAKRGRHLVFTLFEVGAIGLAKLGAARAILTLATALIAVAAEIILFQQLAVAKEQRDLLERQNTLFADQLGLQLKVVEQTRDQLDRENRRFEDAVLFSPDATRSGGQTRLKYLFEYIAREGGKRPDQRLDLVGLNLVKFRGAGPGTLANLLFSDCDVDDTSFHGLTLSNVTFAHSGDGRQVGETTDLDFLACRLTDVSWSAPESWSTAVACLNCPLIKDCQFEADQVYFYNSMIDSRASFDDHTDCVISVGNQGLTITSCPKCGLVRVVAKGGRDKRPLLPSVSIYNTSFEDLVVQCVPRIPSQNWFHIALTKASGKIRIDSVASQYQLDVHNCDVSGLEIGQSPSAGTLTNLTGLEKNPSLLKVNWSKCSADEAFIQWHAQSRGDEGLRPKLIANSDD